MDTKCPVCHSDLNSFENMGYTHCPYCGYDEQHEEAKNEVIYVIKYALNHLAEESKHNEFGIPNGSIWSYDEVLNFVKSYLK